MSNVTTARIIGVPGVHTVDADPMSDASLMTAAKKIGACPGERVEFTFDPSTNAGARTYLVNPDLTLSYMGREPAPHSIVWDELIQPKQKRFDLWQWVLDRWARS